MNEFKPKAISKASLYLTQQLEKLTQLEQLNKKIKAQTSTPKEQVNSGNDQLKSTNILQKILKLFRP